jgi:glucose/arabinose dehydrogenase
VLPPRQRDRCFHNEATKYKQEIFMSANPKHARPRGFGPALVPWKAALSAAVFASFAVTSPVQAAGVPSGFTDTQVATGLTSPTSMTVMPDGRVLVVQQNGVIRILKNDVMLATPFTTIANVDSTNERGCLGIITDPAFATNHHVYIYCSITNGTNSFNRIMRVTEGSDTVVAGSLTTILDLPTIPAATKWHMGGALRFGADGKLYVAVGNHEDNVQTFENSNAQKLSVPFGKILRINKDGTIPTDNPYYTTAGAYTANWNLGFRNPFTFDIQPGTGLMYVNDVGQGTWEEINRGLAGANYGWPAAEGNSTDVRFTNPVYAYSHSGGCSISGGAFYNPLTNQFPASYTGKYLFADFCNGTIKLLDPASPATPAGFATGIGNPVNIGLAPDGSLYYLARNQQTGNPTVGAGTVSKIKYTGSLAPQITTNPQSQTIYVGNPVTFTVAASGATSYQWRRNGTNISGATATSYTIPAVATADNGVSFTAAVTNASGTTVSTAAVLTVTTNQFPVGRIDNPTTGSGYATGDKIVYSATGNDAEDGSLPATAFTWKVDFHHDTHSHPFMAATAGAKSGSFVLPDFEADAGNTWLRFTLTVKDSGNLTHTVIRDIYPRKMLSDMTPTGTPVNGWGPFEKDKSNGEAGAADGITMSLAGITYARGLGVHAPSEIRYNLGGACSGKFVADVGIDDEAGDAGTVIFQVFLDGVKAYDSGIVRGSDLRALANVSVAGKNELRLVVTDAGDGNAKDHADWAGARVTGCNAVTAMSVLDTANAADWSVQTNLQAGNIAYGDRAFTIDTVPAVVAGGTWLQAANDSKTYTGSPLVSFNLTAASTVYVGLDDRVSRPAWLDATWVDAGVDLVVRESATVTRPVSLYKKSLPIGTVSLGALNNTNSNMYVVIVK